MHYSISSYSFINAKLSAIKSRLLKENDYEVLVSLNSLEEMIDKLEKTYYKRYIEELSVFVSGSKLIESASNKWLVSLYKDLSKFVPPSDREKINVMLHRHEIRNLKLLISAKIRGVEWDVVENLIVPIYPLSSYRRFYESDFKDILRFTEVGRDILGLKLSNLWRGKERIMKSLLKEGRNDIFIFSSLELYYAYYLENTIKPLSRMKPAKILLYEQDLKNIGVLFRFLEEQRGEEELLENLLEGGTISHKDLLKAYVNEAYRKELIERFGVKYDEDLFKVEHELFLKVSKMKREFTYVKPGLEKVLGFFMLAESEVERLGFIARAKEMGIDNESVWRLVL